MSPLPVPEVRPARDLRRSALHAEGRDHEVSLRLVYLISIEFSTGCGGWEVPPRCSDSDLRSCAVTAWSIAPSRPLLWRSIYGS